MVVYNDEEWGIPIYDDKYVLPHCILSIFHIPGFQELSVAILSS
jgi:3-methyladenine DNA glycosylase Tag